MSRGQGERRGHTAGYGAQPKKGEKYLHHLLIVEDGPDAYKEEEGVEADKANSHTADHLHK